MKLSELKSILSQLSKIAFQLPDGSLVPSHFHVTEVGSVHKTFIDCGGTVREEHKIGLQLWEANDYDHRLHPEKLMHILELSEKTLGLPDHDIEVEYQGATIGKYHLEFQFPHFLLTPTRTDCLAKEQCGIPASKPKIKLSELQSLPNSCTPGSGCC